MTLPREEWRLDTRRFGRRVLVYDRVDSTNAVAARLADDPANDGVAVLAAEQTAGRGQRGRRWQAPPGSSVLLSVLVFPPSALRRPAVLTAWAAVSVCDAVAVLTGASAQIKWPNDVLVGGRKVCGILIEQGRAAVVGIGLNVAQTADDFAAAGLPQAASLAQIIPAAPGVRAAAERLLRQLDEEYDRLVRGGPGALEGRWGDRIGLVGREVTAECHDSVRRGRLLELGFDGVALGGEDGGVRILRPEAVLQLGPAGPSAREA
jgi:BirA family biotin operon repressor/biotin-[acetyl-CoA-carboxylase] ligase